MTMEAEEFGKKILRHIVNCQGCQRTVLSCMHLKGEHDLFLNRKEAGT